MPAWGIILIIIGAVALLAVIWGVSTSNSLRRMQIKIKETLSGIDVALTKRYDVLTKMLDVTKAYAKHEKETLFEVIKMRKGMTMSERNEANAQMDAAMRQINVVAENYPELKSSENFKQLQVTILDVEEHLQASRRAYNANVSTYNQAIVTFPKSIIAGMIGAKAEEFFEAEAAKRSDVKMDFNM